MITAEDILTSSGRHHERMDWVSPAVARNAADLAPRITLVLVRFGESRKVYGFRDPESNKNTLGAAAYSRHMYGEAGDVEDKDRKLCKFSTEKLLEEAGLWMEDPRDTPTWAHYQNVPPTNWKPGMSRIFRR